MKTALIMCNYERQGFPPLGILYLAGYSREYAPDSELLVFDVIPDVDDLLRMSPDVIALSAMTFQYPSASRFAEELRHSFNGIIVIGGVHISLVHNLPSWADIGIIGEGEETFTELIRALSRGSDISQVKGLIYRNDGELRRTPPRGLIKELDSIPFPARDLISMEPYLKNNNVYGTVVASGLSLMTSRGCVFNCDFCSSSKMWNTIRFHSAEYVFSEIVNIISRWNVNHFWIADDHFALNLQRLKRIADMLEMNGIKVHLGINMRVEAYSAELSQVLHRLGVESISFGLETGSDRMLHQIKKGNPLTVEQETAIVKQAVSDGYEIHGMFMVNIPGETRKDLMDTVKLIHDLPLAKCSVAVATPYAGTRWWEIAVSQGIVPSHPDDAFWRSYDMKTLDSDRPIFRNEVGREELCRIYSELQNYSRQLFHFDWRHRT